MEASDEKTHTKIKQPSPFELFKSGFKDIFDSPRELLILYLINICASFQYYLVITLLPLFYSDIQGFSDLMAGLVFGCYGIGLGLVAISLGPLSNKIGVKAGLIISSIFGLIGFFLLTVTYNLFVNTFSVVLFHTISGALAWPVVELGIKLYTKKEFRNIANTLCLMSNFVAGIFSGIYIDIIWYYYEEDEHTLYQIFFATGIGFALISLILSQTLRKSAVVERPAEVEDENFGQLSKRIISQKRF